MNTAIALAEDPGRDGDGDEARRSKPAGSHIRAGTDPEAKSYASASSPVDGGSPVVEAAVAPAARWRTRADRSRRCCAGSRRSATRRTPLQRSADRARPRLASGRLRFPRRLRIDDHQVARAERGVEHPAGAATGSRLEAAGSPGSSGAWSRPTSNGSSPSIRCWSITSTAARRPRATRIMPRTRSSRCCATSSPVLAEFQSRLMLLLQQITAYVDTRDRDSRGGALVLNASLSGLAENVAKRSNRSPRGSSGTNARTRRFAAAHDELRATLGVLQHGFDDAEARDREEVLEVRQGLRRFRRARFRRVHGGSRITGSRIPAPRSARSGVQRHARRVQVRRLRRSVPRVARVIRARLESYLPLLRRRWPSARRRLRPRRVPRSPGRARHRARGIDLNHEMAEVCRARGLDVTEADAVGYLSTLPDGSLGGIFSAQVVEHLQPGISAAQFLELRSTSCGPAGGSSSKR